MIAMVPADQIERMNEEIELHKNMVIGYALALRGEGLSTTGPKEKLAKKEKVLSAKHD